MKKTFISVKLSLIILVLFTSKLCFAEEYSVPNEGSPYKSIDNIQYNEIIHLPTGLVVDLDQMVDTVVSSRVVYIGETHDNLEAHRIQLEVIKKLFERRKGKIAVGMEMFRKSAQHDLNLWYKGQLSDEKFKKVFRKNWGGGFKLYQPIFEFLKSNNVQLIGLKSSKETEARLKKGFTQVNFPEMDENDIYHKAYADAIFGGNSSKHGHGNNMLYKMLVLWDESMAETVADFLRDPQQSDSTLIVLAGGFHVQYGYGIPKRAFRREPHSYSTILPFVSSVPSALKDREMKIKPVSIPLVAADFGWKIDYKVLPKNKIRLGIGIEEVTGGVKVKSVSSGSVAEKMDIRKGDLLLTLDKEKLSGITDLIDRLQIKSFGDPISIKVSREETEVQLQGIIKKFE
ncbi:MAG: ChaN family lipoprotein [Nitrospinales bacterium]